jgi:hypothetical protein
MISITAASGLGLDDGLSVVPSDNVSLSVVNSMENDPAKIRRADLPSSAGWRADLPTTYGQRRISGRTHTYNFSLKVDVFGGILCTTRVKVVLQESFKERLLSVIIFSHHNDLYVRNC